jgi:peptidoglycan pentaglycine glycine transferase (the first glycine)
MNKYKVKVLEETDKKVWNLFVDHSPWGDMLQLWEWGELKRSEGWRPMRVAVIEEGKIRLVAQILLKPVPLLGNYAYIPHGPVVHNTDDLTAVFRAFIDYLSHYSKTYDFVSLEMDPKLGKFLPDDKHPNIPDNLKFYTNSSYYKALEDNGVFITGRNTQPVYKLMYDLNEADEELLAHCNKSTRYNIRYAQKKGVQIKEYLPSDPNINSHIDKFYELLKETQVRAKGYPMHSKNYFYKLFELFRDSEHVVLTEAIVEGDTVAMNISQRTKGWSSSFYAGSNRLHPKSKAAYLLRWESIQSAKKYGSKNYDFWGIIPNSTDHQGYSSHKLGYGGYRIDTYGLLAVPLNPLKYSLWTNAIWLRTKGLSEARKVFWNFRKQTLPKLKNRLTKALKKSNKTTKSEPEKLQDNNHTTNNRQSLASNQDSKSSLELNLDLPTTNLKPDTKPKPKTLPKQNYLPKQSHQMLQLQHSEAEKVDDKVVDVEISEVSNLSQDKLKESVQTKSKSNEISDAVSSKIHKKLPNNYKHKLKSKKPKSKVIKNLKRKNKTRSKIS